MQRLGGRKQLSNKQEEGECNCGAMSRERGRSVGRG
jgi:hypothetical protein